MAFKKTVGRFADLLVVGSVKKSLVLALIILLCNSMLWFSIGGSAQTDFKEITINEDGSVNPSNVPITRYGNVYILTADIFGQITIKCDGVTIDGTGHTITGYGNKPSNHAYSGVQAFGQTNIVLKNIKVTGLYHSVFAALSNSEIYNCEFIDCEILSLFEGVNNTLSGNRIVGCTTGVFIDKGGGNVLTDNYFANNTDCAIEFLWSKVTLRNNTFENNVLLFYFPDKDYIQDIDSSNVVDGMPVCYWFNEHDRAIPSDAGYVFLFNCTRMIIQGLSIPNQTLKNFTSDSKGLTLIDTVDSTITNCNLNGGAGISISGSATKNITISNNNFSTKISVLSANVNSNVFSKGAELIVDNSTVSSNWIDSCDHGLTIYGGKDSEIYCNEIENCNIGLFIHHSVRNNIYSNNFVNNNQSVFEDPQEMVQTMFGLLPAHYESVNTTFDGNYWSEYSGSDYDFNGIGDTPYTIFENFTDLHPRMQRINIENDGIAPQNRETMLTVYVAGSAVAVAIIVVITALLYQQRKKLSSNRTTEKVT